MRTGRQIPPQKEKGKRHSPADAKCAYRSPAVNVICIDIGTTAAKAAAFADLQRVGPVLRRKMPLLTDGDRAELLPQEIIKAVADLIAAAAERLAGRVDFISIAAMSPAICLLDARGRPLTPVITHMDRRSEKEALEILHQFGKPTLLAKAGNLPFPGGIASTTLRWLQLHEPDAYRRAARLVTANALITGWLTGRYLCDPANATFLGLFDISRGRWWDEMLEFLALPVRSLPTVADGSTVAGRPAGALCGELHLKSRPRVLTGLMDTSAVCLAAGLQVGHMYNAVGTTDVLAMCVDGPHPDERLLTRPVGTGGLWLSVHTMAAAGAALQWAHRTFFADMPERRFYDLLESLRPDAAPPDLRVLPDLAGDRMKVRQSFGRITGLRLSTTREQILAAILRSLARRSARRLSILSRVTQPTGEVFVAGGAGRFNLQRFWPSRYRFHRLPPDASLRGLARLASSAR